MESAERGESVVTVVMGRVPMNLARADYVRYLRVEHECTWRAVAAWCNDQWLGDWGSNQLVGEALCDVAAALLGEEKGW